LATESLTYGEAIALLAMSLSGLGAWWYRNFKRDRSMVAAFAALGTISAAWLLWSVW